VSRGSEVVGNYDGRVERAAVRVAHGMRGQVDVRALLLGLEHPNVPDLPGRQIDERHHGNRGDPEKLKPPCGGFAPWAEAQGGIGLSPWVRLSGDPGSGSTISQAALVA
jgi:hypothetical protein